MFRLPVCPYCGTVYRYKEVGSAIRKKEITCYHCEKKFRVRLFPTILVGVLIPLLLCVGLNIFLLTRMESVRLLPLFGVTLLFILITVLIIPFFTSFKKKK